MSKSPFPGMDPFIEANDLWDGFQTLFITKMLAHLNGSLPKRYIAIINHDDDFNRKNQPFIKIIQNEYNEEITYIYMLSPADKVGDGFKLASEKRIEIIKEKHLNYVGIDLLRGGEKSKKTCDSVDFIAWYTSFHDENSSIIKPFYINKPLTKIRIPLEDPDFYFYIDLQDIFEEPFSDANYIDLLDYSKVLNPPLPDEKAQWVAEQVKPFLR